MNWAYVGLVALIVTIVFPIMMWSLTSQFLADLAQGIEPRGGWSWLSISIFNVFLLGIIAALYWKIYCDANTTIDKTGVSRPTLLGRCDLSWHEITDLRIFRGVGLHLYVGRKRRLVISPYAYKDPERVALVIYECIKQSREQVNDA